MPDWGDQGQLPGVPTAHRKLAGKPILVDRSAASVLVPGISVLVIDPSAILEEVDSSQLTGNNFPFFKKTRALSAGVEKSRPGFPG